MFLWPPGTREVTRHDVERILWTLHLDGDIEGTSNATGELRARVAARGEELYRTSSLQPLLAELEGDRYGRPFIERDVRPPAKKCYAIRLLPDVTADVLPDNPFISEKPSVPSEKSQRLFLGDEVKPGCEVGPCELERFHDGDHLANGLSYRTEGDLLKQRMYLESPTPAVSLSVDDVRFAPFDPSPEPVNGHANGVSLPPDPTLPDESGLSILDKLEVIQRFTFDVMMAIPALSASASMQDREMAENLARALDEAERMRKRARDAEETALAHKNALEAAQRMNRRLEANNAALLKGDRPADTSGFIALRNVMQEKPRVKTGD